MSNENDAKWSPTMFMAWAVLIDLAVVTCLFIMPLLKLIEDVCRLICLTIISWFLTMTSIFRRWKNRLRCSNKRHLHRSPSSILNDTELKSMNVTMERLANENRFLKERFDRLNEQCQRWIGDEQVYLLRRIEQLEAENRQLHTNYRNYQIRSEKCIQSVTDLIMKVLFTQEELRKQCSEIHTAFDTVQLRKKVQQNEAIPRSTRSISCQFASNPSNHTYRHTINEQPTWLHEQLRIVEKDDLKPSTTPPTELHISESQSSVYSPNAAASKYNSHLSSTGLTNELYFVSHKPDGDQEKTPPVLLRHKRRSPHQNSTPLEETPVVSNHRRPISSPVRSTTYVLQQHHRINTNQQPAVTSKKHPSPVTPRHHHHQPSPVVPNKARQTQQQRTYSNHERSPPTVDASTTNQQFTSRAHITLTPQRTTPIVKNTPTKTTTYTPRSPRIPYTPPVRPSRPSAPVPTLPSQPRSPRVQLRSRNYTPATQRTISSSPAAPSKSIRVPHTSSKSPEQLRSITGAVVRPRPVHTVVAKSKITTTNNQSKTRAPTVPAQPTLAISTPRVSDLDALMAEKQDTTVSPVHTDKKSMLISPSPITDNIRRSLFSPNSVKVVRPVRSQELKTFSCHLPAPLTVCDENNLLHIDETRSTCTTKLSEWNPDRRSHENQSTEKTDDSLSNASVILRELSEDSLNEHYHIRQLLKSNASITGMKHDSTPNNSSNDDIPLSPAVTSWSRIRSSCESNLSHVPPLKSDTSTSPALYNGPFRQEDIHMVDDGRYFLLIDDNMSSEESQLSTKSLSSSSSSSLSLSRPRSPSPPPARTEAVVEAPAAATIAPSSAVSTDRKPLIHRLVFPDRLGRIVFYRRTLSDTDIYQKLCSKDNEISHNVYHLDTIRDYAMEFYMLTTYGSDSQLRAWLDSHDDDAVNNTCYFDDNRFQSFDEDNDDDDDEEEENELDRNRMKTINSNDSIIPEEDLNQLQVDEELDWYSELESFNLAPNNQQWKPENLSSCSSEDQVEELLRAEQFSVSSLTTTTSAESSCSAGLISASWPLANGSHYAVHSGRSSHSLNSPSSSKYTDQSHTLLKEILTYPWNNEISDSPSNAHDTGPDQLDNGISSSSVVSDEFQPDFYYLSPLKNTTSYLKTDEKANGIHQQLSHDV